MKVLGHIRVLSFADDVLLLDMLPLNFICDVAFGQKHFNAFQVEQLVDSSSQIYIIKQMIMHLR